ncbi:hypothetical protein MSPP1_000610 [Malassezia sp. CBS 17886]|nr:hypothetical protein MSPP1_000610 [Malassezia sp. CBS 17886]
MCWVLAVVLAAALAGVYARHMSTVRAPARAWRMCVDAGTTARDTCTRRPPHLVAAPRRLPAEVQLQTLRELVRVCTNDPRSSHAGLWKVLALSRAHARVLLPVAYHTIILRSPSSAQRLRTALTRWRPDAGACIRALHVEACAGSTAVAMEQLLLCAPSLEHLSVDAGSADLLASGADRLQKAPAPVAFTVDLGECLPCLFVRLVRLRLLGRVATLSLYGPVDIAHTAVAHITTAFPSLRRVHVSVRGSMRSPVRGAGGAGRRRIDAWHALAASLEALSADRGIDVQVAGLGGGDEEARGANVA